MSRHRLPFASMVFLAALLGAAGAGAVDLNARREFNIPAQTLSSALVEFGRQTSIQIMTASTDLANIQVAAVQGTMPIKTALTRLLNGTNLQFRDAGKNSLTIARASQDPRATALPEGSGSAVPASRLARARADAAMQQVEDTQVEARDRQPDPDAQSGELEVTGSRIRRDPVETGISPVQVYDREMIEHSGAIFISDFLRQLPQNANDLTGLTSSAPMGNRTRVDLRGMGPGNTLVLLNGRRLTRSGQAFSGSTSDYDLSGIALASVERIEVLTDGASAIYGADAVGGVVNIITRKDYRGVEAGLQYVNTTHQDAAEKSATLSAGFAGRGTHADFSVTASTRNSYGGDARPYTATSDFSSSGGLDSRVAGGGAGVVYEFEGALASGFAEIPPGQDGTNLDADSFAPYDGVDSLFDFAPFTDAVDANDDISARVAVQHDLRRWLTAYVELGRSRHTNRSFGAPPRVEDAYVPPYNPFNPFGTELLVNKTFYELGRSEFVYESTNEDYSAGFRGELGKTWRYDASFSRGRVRNEAEAILPDTIYVDPLLDPEDTSVQFNIFADGRIPLPASHVALLRTALGQFEYNTLAGSDTAEFRADGGLWRTPAGLIRIAVGAETRKESLTHFSLNTTGRTYAQISRDTGRRANALYAELQAPLVRADSDRLLLKSLDVLLAARNDDIDGFDAELSPKAGFMWQPFNGVRLRASVGEGFRVPNLYFLVLPTTTRSVRYTAFSNIIDRARNELLVGNFLVTTGGNPDLKAEQSESRNFGIVLEPRFVPGLTLSADYYDIRHTDKVSSTLLEQDIIDFFPERFTRGPTVNGVPGRILSLDRRAVNLQGVQATGMDVRLAFRRDTGMGSITSIVSGSRAFHWQQKTSAASAFVDRIDSFAYPKWRASANFFWQREALGAGMNWRYSASIRNNLPNPRRVASASEFDLNGTYDFSERARSSFNILRDVKINLTIMNVLDTEPPHTNGDGSYMYMDPRQRRYSLALTKRF